MADSLSKALVAVTEALSNPPSPENINMGTAIQLLRAMDRLRVMLEPPNLAVLNLSLAVSRDKLLKDVNLTDSVNSRML